MVRFVLITFSLEVFFFILCLSLLSKAGTSTCVNSVLDSWIYQKTLDTPRHKIQKDSLYRQELVSDLINGSLAYKKDPIMPFLAVFFAFKESSFNEFAQGDVIGGIPKAKGLMQFHSGMRVVCSKQLDLNLNKRLDQIVCFSYWMDKLTKRCGSLEGAIRAYASKGGNCGGTPKGRRIAKHRMKQVYKLYKKCYEE